MDINLTLFGEMLTFAILVWVTMHYIWPPMMKSIQERQAKVAAGLAAAKQGQEALARARQTTQEQLKQARMQAAMILEEADQAAELLFAENKRHIEDECAAILAQNRLDLANELAATKKHLQQQNIELAVLMAEKILARQIDVDVQRQLLQQLITKIQQ